LRAYYHHKSPPSTELRQHARATIIAALKPEYPTLKQKPLHAHRGSYSRSGVPGRYLSVFPVWLNAALESGTVLGDGCSGTNGGATASCSAGSQITQNV